MNKEEAREHPSVAIAAALPHPWNQHFAKSTEEAKNWKPRVRYRALSSRIMAVAKTRIECAWSAYVDVVPGENHATEYQEVLRYGTKLPEAIALAIFPEFEGVPYHM